MTFSAVATGPDEPSVITIHCEDGALQLTAAELLFAKRAEPFVRVAGEDLVQRPGNSMGGAFATGTLHLGRALKRALDDGDRSGLAAAATFDDGLAQQRVLDAARASEANDGRWMGV
jgi:predicted dehydrogenase